MTTIPNWPEIELIRVELVFPPHVSVAQDRWSVKLVGHDQSIIRLTLKQIRSSSRFREACSEQLNLALPPIAFDEWQRRLQNAPKEFGE